jgi:hypothetical protein
MNRIKSFLLCLVLLALAGILHHEWQQMSGSSLITTPAYAAVLSNSSGQSCTGLGTWHFVNNQTQGVIGNLNATFSCGTVSGVPPSKTLSSTNHYIVVTDGACTLQSAETPGVPGKLVLSDFTCTPGPTPTPTPTPSPTPI